MLETAVATEYSLGLGPLARRRYPLTHTKSATGGARRVPQTRERVASVLAIDLSRAHTSIVERLGGRYASLLTIQNASRDTAREGMQHGTKSATGGACRVPQTRERVASVLEIDL